ncbi:uroporphyrinogen decarboxylase family protein [uncultured Bacteroides sp.]|uniref:uroporphyrinogen decarboxylase family protein n=2 Tax=uncultured Bacteroides sp. TaxID=162156 RepID=UPI0025DC80D1|nr:uroporphyrinogen decarboxylase family protein [uncultured Bacteroides sp.]
MQRQTDKRKTRMRNLFFILLCIATLATAQTPTNKREVMQQFLNGTLDKSYVPSAFFMHFGKDAKIGENAINAHLRYFLLTGMDFVKIQFEQGYGRIKIEKAEDWDKIRPLPNDFFAPTLNVVKGIYDIAGTDAMVLPTVYSPFQMLIQTVGAKTVVAYADKEPERIKQALEYFTDALIGYVKACKQIGVDGFYTPTQGGEQKFYEVPGFFDTFVKPYDLKVMKECNTDTKLNILHICDYEGSYDDLTRFTSYPGQIVNAPIEVNGKPFSLKDCERLFKRPVMGGLYRKGTILEGSKEQVAKEVKTLKHDLAGKRFILGADCTVLPKTPMDNIRTAIQTSHHIHE